MSVIFKKKNLGKLGEIQFLFINFYLDNFLLSLFVFSCVFESGRLSKLALDFLDIAPDFLLFFLSEGLQSSSCS